MTKASPRGSQRIGYYEGQLLASRDLRDDVTYEARMRGLHVTTVHNTWGVALGFEISTKNRKVIEMGPGIAYDCHGREIISSHTFEVGLPPAPTRSKVNAWLFDLVISYHDLKDIATTREFVSSCLPSCASDEECTRFSPTEERPAWRWRFAGDAVERSGQKPAVAEAIRLGEEVPLARFRMADDGTISEPDFSERRNAQGLVRPHIAGGQIDAEFPVDLKQLAFSMKIDTTAGGFNQTPFYFARVSVPALLAEDSSTTTGIAVLQRVGLGPFVSIRESRRNHFTLDVRFALSSLTTPDVLSSPVGIVALAREDEPAGLSFIVNWVGIEPIGGCVPPLQLIKFFLYAPRPTLPIRRIDAASPFRISDLFFA